MYFIYRIMTEAVEAGAGLAWRLLATLEGGSLLVATSALIAYTAGLKFSRTRQYRVVKTVLVRSCPKHYINLLI